jgi:hypothetical protein
MPLPTSRRVDAVSACVAAAAKDIFQGDRKKFMAGWMVRTALGKSA